MMAASIGTSDPWVLSSAHGTVLLAPLRLMSMREQQIVPDAGELMDLYDLGYTAGVHAEDLGGAPGSPVTGRSEVVILLPWSLLPVIAKLEAHARATPFEHDPQFAPEDWLATWHHFIEFNPQSPPRDVELLAREAVGLQLAQSPRRRHLVLGTIWESRGSVDNSTDERGTSPREARHDGQMLPSAPATVGATSLSTPGAPQTTEV
jgi:hypothetical protein